MALYASPFFQNVLSLTDHCVPPPPITTYQHDFVDPEIKRDPEYDDPSTNKTLDALGVKRRVDKVPANAQYCSCRPQDGEKKILKKNQSCPKRITTYMISYKNPEEIQKRWDIFIANRNTKDSEKLPAQVESVTAHAKVSALQNLNTTCECWLRAKNDQDNHEKVTPSFAPKPIVPQWKINGWKAKQNCWIRPLKERKEYYATLQYKSNKNNKSKCCST